jgi:uncharacterized protein YjbJ (UPF0337 family)
MLQHCDEVALAGNLLLSFRNMPLSLRYMLITPHAITLSKIKLKHGPLFPRNEQLCHFRVATHRPGTFAKALCWSALQAKMECLMDWNRIEGNWKQFKGRAKEKWGRLTDDDLDVVNGRREQLEGKIQERYGLARDQAKQDVDAWSNSLTNIT